MDRTKVLDYRLASHRELRRQVFLRDRFTCQVCGYRPAEIPGPNYDGRYVPKPTYDPFRYLQVDHIRPLCANGERLDVENLQALCNSCNGRKSGRDDGLGTA